MKKTPVALPLILLVAFAQSVLAQSAVETALAATVTIEVTGPDGESSGSGFITSSDGIIVTAAHVMEGATSAVVRLQNGEELNVEGVIEIDGVKDFAIVRVAGFDLPTVPLGNADNVSVGQRIIVIGAPIGLSGTVSDGLVAADRLVDGTRMIQISAPTSPGNSGGPVLTEQGQVIGLVVSGIAAEGAENLNFALPINYVRGQLALAASKPLQPLSEVSARTQVRITAAAGATATCSMSSTEVESLRSLAEQGEAPSQARLGRLHYEGDCVPQDYAEAVRWYRLSAEQGNSNGQHSLGGAYTYGRGVPQDYAEGSRWYRLSAEQGYVPSQVNLGWAYGRGQGVPEDDAEAVHWYRLAADQGDAVAQHNIGYRYDVGSGVPEDDVQAYMWYNLSAAQGNETAQKNKDILEGKLSRAQIAEGQRLSREWMAEHTRGGN